MRISFGFLATLAGSAMLLAACALHAGEQAQPLISKPNTVQGASPYVITIIEHPLPRPNSEPNGMVPSPNLPSYTSQGPFYVEQADGYLDKWNTLDSANFSFFMHIRKEAATKLALRTGHDFWWTDPGNNAVEHWKVPQTTTRPVVFPIPTANANPLGITIGPDGNIWFTEYNANKIGVITPTGSFTEYNIPTAGSEPFAITSGPDGNLWFTEYAANQIGRITTGGAISEFAIPTAASGPHDITVGFDNELWFTEFNANKIGKVTTDGSTFTEYTVPTANSEPYGIATAKFASYVFWTEWAGNKIGRIGSMGGIAEYRVPTANSEPIEIVPSQFKSIMWFDEFAGNAVCSIGY